MADKDIKLRLLIEAVNKAGSQLQTIATDLNKIGTTAKGIGTQVSNAGKVGAEGLDKISSSSGSAVDSFDLLKGAVLGFGISAANILAQIISKLSELGLSVITTSAAFERSMSGVEAVSQVTEAQFAKLADEAKRLGAETKFTAVEAAEGLRFLAMAGLNAEQAFAALAPTLDLAAAGELSVAESADTATNVMSAMNLDVQDLNHVMDVLAYTAANSNTNIKQMAEALKYVAPIAASAGVKIDEVGALIGRLGSNGIQASQAGTSLRGMIIALAAPTSQAKKVLEQLGVEVSKNADGSLNLTRTLKDLYDANLDVATATAIFRRTSAAAALALAKDTDNINSLTEANRNADAAAKQMAVTMERNLLGAITRLKSAVEGLKISFGEDFLKTFTLIIDAITYLVSSIVALDKELKKLGVSISKIVLPKITSLLDLGKAVQKHREELQKSKVVIDALQGSRDTEIKSLEEINNLTDKEAEAYARDLSRKKKYFESVAKYAEDSSSKIGDFIGKTLNALSGGIIPQTLLDSISNTGKEFDTSKEAIEEFKQKSEEAGNALALVASRTSQSTIDIAESIKVLPEELDAFEKSATKAYKEVVKEAEKYSDDVTKFEEKASLARIDAIENIRKANRLADEDSLSSLDQRVHTEQEISNIRKALADEDYAVAEKLIKNTESLYDDMAKSIEKSYDSAQKAAQKYYDKVKEFEEKAQFARLSTEDKIRELGRKTLGEQEAWLDRRKQAEEKAAAATKALEENNFDLATKLVKESENLYSGLAENVYTKVEKETKKATDKSKQSLLDLDTTTKTMTDSTLSITKQIVYSLEETSKIAADGIKQTGDLQARIFEQQAAEAKKAGDASIESANGLKEQLNSIIESGVTTIGKLHVELFEQQAEAAKKARDEFYDTADSIKKKLDEITEDRKVGVEPELIKLREFEDEVNDKLAAYEFTARVKLEVEEVETKAHGGLAGYARGGKLPGESKKDSIPVLARPGEWFINNEAAHTWEKTFGSGFMSAINNPWSEFGKRIRSTLLGSVPRFNLGGLVNKQFRPSIPAYANGGSIDNIRDLGKVEIDVEGRGYPVMGNIDVLSQLKTAIEKEKLVRSNN